MWPSRIKIEQANYRESDSSRQWKNIEILLSKKFLFRSKTIQKIISFPHLSIIFRAGTIFQIAP